MRALFAVLVLTMPALAADQTSFYGEWGTKVQCARALITANGTVRSSPFVIQADWLGQGDVWCRLNWSTAVTNTDGVIAVARALCGEDAVQSYYIKFDLTGDKLTLIWNQQLENGPLMRCVG